MANQNLPLKVIEVIVLGGILAAFVLPLFSLLNEANRQSSLLFAQAFLIIIPAEPAAIAPSQAATIL